MDGSRGNFLKFKKGAQRSMLHNRGKKKVLNSELMKHMKIHINLVIDSGEMQD